MAECVAVLDPLRWVRDRSFPEVEILTDCLVMVQGLRAMESVDILVKPVSLELLDLV